MLIVAAVVSLLAIAGSITSQFGRYAGRQQGASDVMTAADSALEYAYSAWVAGVRQRGGIAPHAELLAAITESAFNTAHPEFTPGGPLGVSVDTLRIARLNADGSLFTGNDKTAGVNTQNVPAIPVGPERRPITRLRSRRASARATASMPAIKRSSTRRATSRLILVPLFQNAIFYEGTLELNPGADMIIKGKVHSNASIWAQGLPVSPAPSVLLQFMNGVSYVNTFNEVANPAAQKGWDGYGYGMFPPASEKNTWSDGLVTGLSTAHDSQITKVSLIDPFGGASTNSNGLHDMIEVPAAGSNSASSTQVEYNQAALRIVINSSATASGTVVSKDANGIVIPNGNLSPAYSVSDGRTTILSPTPTENLDNSIALTATDLTNIKAALTIGSSLADWREGVTTPVTVDSLDIAKFTAATSAAGTSTPTTLQKNFNANGAVYIHDVSTANKTAIRLLNGRTFVNDLTVATDNGVYVQGDFNTGGAGPSDVPSNQSNPDGSAVHVASNYTEHSVAIMADAVTILSNSWNDANAAKALTSRNASATTINAAIVAGDVPTNLSGNQTASGGAHNFPRFLENWQNINFTYWGSLVEAYNSEKFTGLWQTNSVYYWPSRKWNFDTNLLTNPPPFAPQGVLFSRGRWERVGGAFSLPTP